MTLHSTQYVSIAIARPLDEVYAFLADPENFPQWASGLGKGFKHLSGMDWSVETPMGPMTVCFSERNAYGVLDHSLIPKEGAVMHNPMRVIANGDGSEVVFTLFRRLGMTDEDFARDAAWISKDLAKLKRLLETRDV